jgi:hypothetical protein
MSPQVVAKAIREEFFGKVGYGGDIGEGGLFEQTHDVSGGWKESPLKRRKERGGGDGMGDDGDFDQANVGEFGGGNDGMMMRGPEGGHRPMSASQRRPLSARTGAIVTHKEDFSSDGRPTSHIADSARKRNSGTRKP